MSKLTALILLAALAMQTTPIMAQAQSSSSRSSMDSSDSSANTTTSSWSEFNLNRDARHPSGHWLSFGILGGLSDYNGVTNSSNQKDARQLGFLLDYSSFLPSYNSVFSITGAVETFDPNQNKNFTNGSLDLGYAYRFANRISFGPSVKAFFGDADRMGGADDHVTSFIGGGVNYDFAIENNLMTVFAKLFTDINIPNRTDVMSYVGLKFGFGGSDEKPVARYREPAAAPVRQQVQRPVRNLNDSLTIDAFQTGKVSLPRSYEGELDDLIADLKSVDVKTIYLYGHADKVGTNPFNDRLSENRAREVRSHFIAAGIEPSKIKIIPYGEHKPVFNRKGEYSYIKSRRVELKVITQ